MPYIPLEKLVTQDQPSLYKLVLTAAARANELAQGAQPLITSETKKVSSVAIEEIAGGKVRYENRESKKSKKSAG